MRKLLVLFLILLSSTCFGATRQKTWSTGDPITENDMNADWDNFYSEKVTSSNIANGAVGNTQLGTITTSNKINFSAIYTAGQAQGDIMYYNGSAWTRLGAGTDGYALKSGGAGANPAWEIINLGAWTGGASGGTYTDGTAYAATTDGFVCAYNTVGVNVQLLTDAANPPTTVRIHNGTDTSSGTIPVIKGNYWKTSGASFIYWIPLGN